jgi:hypothetical protein
MLDAIEKKSLVAELGYMLELVRDCDTNELEYGSIMAYIDPLSQYLEEHIPLTRGDY